jgi:NAD(P)-dependent dehydrogenase (short-subunit alcohol dehydrogenase family)
VPFLLIFPFKLTVFQHHQNDSAGNNMFGQVNTSNHRNVAVGCLAAPEEVSNLILFLGSDESSYITGAVHIIDAG